MQNLNSQTKKSIIVSLVVFILLIVGGALFYTCSVEKVREECNRVNKEMSDRIQGATRQLYRAITDIQQGQIITADLVQLESSALSDTVASLLMDANDIGKMATVDISAGEDIHKSMVGEVITEDLQEVELNCIWLSTNLKQYDYVDIRILYPNGTDYIVASKKSVRNIKLRKNNVFFWLTEDEILNIDSAIVDANLHGAKIYTTKYVDSALENPTKVTYQPTDAVIDLLNSDPNVLVKAKENLSKAARAEMETKLQQFKDSVVDKKADDQEKNYDFHLDTTTNGGTNGSSDNNNGVDEEDYDTDRIESSRNTDTDAAADGTDGPGEGGE